MDLQRFATIEEMKKVNEMICKMVENTPDKDWYDICDIDTLLHLYHAYDLVYIALCNCFKSAELNRKEDNK
jgi:hypothetical protein